jgi:hypothetical protein
MIFPIDCTATLLVWLQKGEQMVLYMKTLWQLLSSITEIHCVFVRYDLRLQNQLIIANFKIKRPDVLTSLRDIASNETAEDILLKVNCKSAYYVEIMRSLHEAVCRQRPELWPVFGSSILTVYEVTDRSVSSSLCRKAEQQSVAVLHTTLFNRQ